MKPGAAGAIQQTLAEHTAQIAALQAKDVQFMTYKEEAARQLGQLNTVTNELADDVADLKRLAEDDLTEEEKAELLRKGDEVIARLQGVASAHTPVPVEPGETPGSEPIPDDEPPA